MVKQNNQSTFILRSAWKAICDQLRHVSGQSRSYDSQPSCQQTNLTNPTMHLSHMPEYTIHNRNVHISVMNGVFWHMGQVHCGIFELGLCKMAACGTNLAPFVTSLYNCGNAIFNQIFFSVVEYWDDLGFYWQHCFRKWFRTEQVINHNQMKWQ